MSEKRAWIVLPDQLSIRVFVDTGIMDGLREHLDGRLAAVFLVPREDAEGWTERLAGVPTLHGEDLTTDRPGLAERAVRRIDSVLDRQLGYYPLAIRLNNRHGFHLQRMQPGHPNWLLDSARVGALPRLRALERAMQRWHFSPRRHVPTRLGEALAADCSALVLSNVQPIGVVPFLTAARRLRLPLIAYVASWDHTVGKGVISPHCDLYLVQNRVMEDDLRSYHGIDGDRVVVTGWPQTDVFHRQRSRADYEELLRGYGLDPDRPVVLVMGNTPTNAPYEGRFVDRLVSWWERDAPDRFQLLFRPHPRDREWRERFGTALDRPEVVVQEPSYTDLEALATLLQHGNVVVCNAGTILLDALVNGRPAVCVLYDEGAPAGESWAAKNVIGKHYEELAASGAFYRAERFEDVVAGIERALSRPDELAEERRRATEQVVGEVDGRAAERVVDAIGASLRRGGA
jgi:UDP-N-acetylglucosamine:LPS N-acetylglucosamine transferase